MVKGVAGLEARLQLAAHRPARSTKRLRRSFSLKSATTWSRTWASRAGRGQGLPPEEHEAAGGGGQRIRNGAIRGELQGLLDDLRGPAELRRDGFTVEGGHRLEAVSLFFARKSSKAGVCGFSLCS